jgi:hypothetical protein
MQCHRVQCLVNYELEQMWNEADMAQLHKLSWHLHDGIELTNKNLVMIASFLAQSLNWHLTNIHVVKINLLLQ